MGGRRTFPKIKGTYLERLPIPKLDFSNAADKSRHDRLVTLVDRMLALHAQLAKTKAPPVRAGLQGQIESTDREIDKLVYDLYALTEDEIRIVEDATER